MQTWFPVAGIALAALLTAVPARAQAPDQQHDVNELAKQTQNPVAALTSVPFQFNFGTGGDLEDRTYLNLNFQPVIPFTLTESVNVIARTIVPINSFPGPDNTRFSGVGDIQLQLFFTPAKAGGLTWGVGPLVSFPTATTTASETGSWSAGPAFVVVKNHGPWVMGGLLTQLWPMADAGGDPEMNLLTFQPFVNYNLVNGWALAFAPIMTANWDASDGNEWTVPLGIGITRTTVFNRRPMNLGVQYYYNVERPDGSAGQQLRFTVSLLYPR
jgi:hypothetical protein